MTVFAVDLEGIKAAEELTDGAEGSALIFSAWG